MERLQIHTGAPEALSMKELTVVCAQSVLV
jgi:hypothetical protein